MTRNRGKLKEEKWDDKKRWENRIRLMNLPNKDVYEIKKEVLKSKLTSDYEIMIEKTNEIETTKMFWNN